MIVYKRGMNKDEHCCCKVKVIKKVFEEEDIVIFYGTEKEFEISFHKSFDSRDTYRFKKRFKIFGTVVAKASLDLSISTCYLYPIKKHILTDELVLKFETEILPKIFDSFKNRDTSPQLIAIELINNNFILHSTSGAALPPRTRYRPSVACYLAQTPPRSRLGALRCGG